MTGRLPSAPRAGGPFRYGPRPRRTKPAEVWLVLVKDGEFGEPAVLAAGADMEAAKRWCDDHRALSNGTAIGWSILAGMETGTSRVKLDLGRHGIVEMDRFYVLQPIRVVT